MKVRNMELSSGNTVANQFTIRHNGCVYFQSYQTIIAIQHKNGSISLDRDKWDYSATTGKYRNQFLGEGIAETREKIKLGVYKLKDLNK